MDAKTNERRSHDAYVYRSFFCEMFNLYPLVLWKVRRAAGLRPIV